MDKHMEFSPEEPEYEDEVWEAIEHALTALTGKTMDELREELERDHTYVVNPRRLEQLLRCESILREVFKKQRGVKFVTKYGDSSHGSIDIRCKMPMLVFDPGFFAEACSLADNFEIIQYLDGNVGIDLMFYDVTKPIE